MKNTLILFSIFALTGAAAGSCSSSPPRRSGTAGETGTAGTTTPTAGTTGTAGTGGDTGTAGTTTPTGGTTGTAGTGGDTGTAGTTTPTGGTTGTAGTGGDTGTAGTTATAGTTGTAGTGGTGGTVACVPGPTTGAGGGTGNSCTVAKWTFTPSAICDSAANNACGFCGNAMTGKCAPKNAIDGMVATRYTSGQTQVGGENFVLSFASPVSVTGIKIDSSGSPTDATLSYLAEYSLDGTTFNGWCPALAGPGSATLDITFPAAITVKALRITQTGMQPSGTTSWWSIDEVTLDGCTAP